MRENRKQRNIPTKTLFAAMVLAAALLSSNAVLARGSAPESSTTTFVQQQNVTVTGRVLDETGAPVIGASVYEKGTKNGSMTDANGRFTLKVKAGASVTVSYIGYLTQSVKASRNMVITLQEDNKTLGEVVVVGYGSQKKENLTGAVASVDVNKTLESRPIVDVGRGLQGSTPGLSITVPDAEIGSEPTIKIRGQFASINGSTSPLILLDNVEIPSITMVNPDDIESISVLKDAAASSIYGAKAAFGVVLITTKKGAKSESMNISYSGNFSWQSTEKDYNMGGLDAWRYIRQADANQGRTLSGAFFYITEEGLAKAEDWQKNYGGKIGKDDPYVYGRDWYVDSQGHKIGLRPFNAYDYMVRQWAPTQEHRLSFNGKSGKTSYNVGLGYLDQSGMNKTAKDDSFQRYNASIRLSTQFN